MEDKKNRLYLGLVLLVVGALSVFMNLFSVNMFQIVMLGAGVSLVLLYFTKRKSWALIVGAYLTFFSLFGMISWRLGHYAGNLFAAMFFVVPGVIFFTFFYHKNKRALLVPASMMFWFGVFILLSELWPFYYMGAGLVLYIIGLMFLTIYILGRDFLGNWSIKISLFFFIIGTIASFSFLSPVRTIGRLGIIFPVILVLAGVLFIISSIRKKKS